MKIDVNKVPPEGLIQEENFNSQDLDLDTQIIAFDNPLSLRAFVRRITNAVNVDVEVSGKMKLVCGRCLETFTSRLQRKFKLNYIVEKNQQFIDLDPDIREELILNYPLNPLCRPDCKGLCYKCGANLNKEKCDCSV
ncbi:MAG: DUF177 domain-containing protein [Candidatus Omnitrophica bacterium]|nr:DUF177 domain-containing protein [Candidatus Omnitrophota bacterium]